MSPTSKSLSTTFTEAGTQVATTTVVEPITLQGEQLNGLHGLVDSILEILPQDQILATFFDKLESDESFRKFVNNIQRPSFAQILSKMEVSWLKQIDRYLSDIGKIQLFSQERQILRGLCFAIL